jgi:hypothetical protein
MLLASVNFLGKNLHGFLSFYQTPGKMRGQQQRMWPGASIHSAREPLL